MGCTVRQKQSAVIEFLVLEGKPPIYILKRLEKFKIYATKGYSAIKKWVFRIKSEEDPSLSDTQEAPNKFRNGLACGRP